MPLSDIKTHTCACEKCKNMCRSRPCWGTPEDINKIIDSGFAHKLMIDEWCATEEQEGFKIIAPALEGHEMINAPWWVHGRCSFLDDNDLCMLHSIGLKPIEGKAAIHDVYELTVDGVCLHETVAMTWFTPEGREVVRKFEHFIEVNREL